MLKKKIIVIAGPTGAGKTHLVHHLYQKGDLLINADSRQVYQEVNIGVAKPSLVELKKYNYQLINFLPLTESFSAHSFLNAVSQIVTLNPKNRILIVGGTNFYLETLVSGLPLLAKSQSSTQINKEKKNWVSLEKEYLAKGLEPFLSELKAKDPDYFEIVDQKNPRRILRAIAHLRSNRETFTVYRQKREKSIDFKILKFVLYPSRNQMYANINHNVEQMFLKGWTQEVLTLKNKYQSKFKVMLHKSALTSIGYLQILEYLQGKITLADCVQTIQTRTRKFAKQQISWLKKQNGIFLTHLNQDEPIDNHSTQAQWLNNLKDFRTENQSNNNPLWWCKGQSKLVNYQMDEIKKIIQQFEQNNLKKNE